MFNQRYIRFKIKKNCEFTRFKAFRLSYKSSSGTLVRLQDFLFQFPNCFAPKCHRRIWTNIVLIHYDVQETCQWPRHGDTVNFNRNLNLVKFQLITRVLVNWFQCIFIRKFWLLQNTKLYNFFYINLTEEMSLYVKIIKWRKNKRKPTI